MNLARKLRDTAVAFNNGKDDFEWNKIKQLLEEAANKGELSLNVDYRLRHSTEEHLKMEGFEVKFQSGRMGEYLTTIKW